MGSFRFLRHVAAMDVAGALVVRFGTTPSQLIRQGAVTPAENIYFHICRFSKSSFSYKNSIFASKVGFVGVFIHLMLDDEW